MSTVPRDAASTTDEPLSVLLFDHPCADIIIRSQDSYHLRVPKVYVLDSSPILGELIRRMLDLSGGAISGASLPVVQLPESGQILRCLLTFIFPGTPLLPSTSEETMEILSVAQKYQMGSVLTHIRDRIPRQHLLHSSLELLLRNYSLAQKYGLRTEALQTAQAIFLKYSMTIEDLENKLDIMPCASLYELLKYHKKIRAVLKSDLRIFRMTCAHGTIAGLRCTELSTFKTPSWFDLYINSIGDSPKLFDFAEFNIAMARHIRDKAYQHRCECASIRSQTIRDFWGALVSVVDGSFRKESVVGILNRLGR